MGSAILRDRHRSSAFGLMMDFAEMIDSQWERVRGRLRDEIGETAYRSWLKPLQLGGVEDGAVRIRVPTRFMRDWVVTHYAERIRHIWGTENPEIQRVDIVVDQTVRAKPAAPKLNAPTTADSSVSSEAAQSSSEIPPASERVGRPAAVSRVDMGRVEPTPVEFPSAPLASGAEAAAEEISAPLDPRYTFDNFVVGKPNEFAYAASRRVAEADRVSFNPLFLYGGVGLGKTHLMHSIAWHIRQTNPGRTVIYLSAEKFMYRFVRALRHQDTMSFKEQFRSVDVLMIDDVQFIAGKDATQEEFFHTFNALVDQGSQIVISADKSPSDLEGMGDRLRSRLGCGLVADIHATTYELRLGILQSKAEQIGAEVPPKVMEFLAHKIISNVRELEGALNRVVAHAQLVGRSINLETTQDVLHDLLRASDRRITIEEIQKKVAEHFKIKLTEMSSARRSRQVARPRQVAMYLAKQLTSRSLPEIGRKFGGRDHTTVMHAVRKVEELRTLDQNFAEDVELLRRMLEG